MKQFCSPNLPNHQVKDVILSGEYTFIVNELRYLGIDCVTVNSCVKLPYYERCHADLQLSHYKTGTVCVGTNTDILCNIPELTVEKGTCLKAEYPYNIAFNHVIMGNTFIGNMAYTDSHIKAYCISKHFQMIDVKQGYTKCSCAIVNENAVITADSAIYCKCLENNIDVLKIDSGYIHLYGYEYGFIGGCCGKISHDVLAFTGKLSTHKNYESIRSFLRQYGVYPLELSNKPLLDIGSILPITEEAY